MANRGSAPRSISARRSGAGGQRGRGADGAAFRRGVAAQRRAEQVLAGLVGGVINAWLFLLKVPDD
jgi:hypothetical protein